MESTSAAQHKWMGHYTTGGQDIAIVISLVMLSLTGLVLMCWLSGIYRLYPGWTPICKFDGDAREDMRIRQWMMYDHAMKHDAERGDGGKYGPQDGVKSYSALGKCTWGTLEAPSQSVPVEYPGVPGASVREGFADTQRLREQSATWARDEPHFISKAGMGAPPLRINLATVTNPRRMV